MRVEQDGVSLVFGPHTDERALGHAWFSLEHAGRLTEFVMALVIDEFGTDETRAKLRVLAGENARLRGIAIERFGRDNPFNESA